MKSFLSITILILSLSTNSYSQSETKKWKWFGGLSTSFDVAMLEEPSQESVFEYYFDGYVTFGAELGLHHERRRISAIFGTGNSINEQSLSSEGGLDGVVELPDYLMFGVTFRQQLTRYKEPPNLVFNAGLRSSMLFSQYSGIQATDHPSDPFDSVFKDYTMNTLGIESGFYFEVQSKPIDKPGISITFEPIFIGASTKGLRFGAGKFGLYLNF